MTDIIFTLFAAAGAVLIARIEYRKYMAAEKILAAQPDAGEEQLLDGAQTFSNEQMTKDVTALEKRYGLPITKIQQRVTAGRMGHVHSFLSETLLKRSVAEQIEWINITNRRVPVCGAPSPVGYECNLKPGHEDRHALVLDGEAFLFWDDTAMKAKAMQPPV